MVRTRRGLSGPVSWTVGRDLRTFGVWTPASLFTDGTQGAWLDLTKPYKLYKEAVGDTPVTSEGDPIGRIVDAGPYGHHAVQSTSSFRPTWGTEGDDTGWAQFDGIDDNIHIPLPDGNYSVIQGTREGYLEYGITVSGGNGWSFVSDPRYLPVNSLTHLAIFEGVAKGAAVKREIAQSVLQPPVSMLNAFRDRTDLTTLDVSNWDTSSVTSFTYFANGASSLTTLDVSNWDTSSVTNFTYFAYGASSLTTLDVSNWDTSSVTNFTYFARGASSLTTLDVSNWDTSSVTNFTYFAYGASSLTTLDVSNWDTSSVTNFSYFASGASSLTTLDVSNWDTSSVTNFTYFAYGASSLTTLDVSNWDTSSVTNFSNFAYGASSLTTLDVSNWDTSSVTNFSNFAYGASSLTTLDVSNWDTSSVTSFSNFARGASSLTTVKTKGGTGSPFSTTANFTNAFTGTNLTQESIDDILEAIATGVVTDGTFSQSGGSAPSTRGQTAIDSLRSRGWTVAVTGGY